MIWDYDSNGNLSVDFVYSELVNDKWGKLDIAERSNEQEEAKTHPNRVEIVQLDDTTSEILASHQAHLRARQGVPAPRFARLLRLWQISDSDGSRRVELKSLLNNGRNSEFSGPLTSFD
ncbi:WD40 repeat protein [Striga asiatica]|uniref:WD40 repeat protein n=1 Tax=Striga asiatica TaxID=4170 RepID=A0A5A7QU43_STRAF|nr:WD40 repeat protein [Striga asiatica]